jgi:hypothetical protein
MSGAEAKGYGEDGSGFGLVVVDILEVIRLKARESRMGSLSDVAPVVVAISISG